MLGPLDYWLHNETSTPELEKALRKLRLKMAERSGVSIIAQRGHGPTNRTRGGLIKQDDPRRLGTAPPKTFALRAFGAALGTVTKHLVAPWPRRDRMRCLPVERPGSDSKPRR